MIINPGMRRSGVRRFSPLALFAASETGVWYDPSDLTTLFQDTSGITPVTAAGQTVALMLDKSRVPAPEARRNIVFNSDTLSGWLSNGGTNSTITTTNPFGVSTTVAQTSSAVVDAGRYLTPATTVGVTYTSSIWLKSVSGATIVRTGNDKIAGWVDVDLSNGTITAQGAAVTASSIENSGSGWYRVSCQYVATAAGTSIISYNRGTTTTTFIMWGAQLEAGSTLTTYQAIGASLPTAWRGTHAIQATAAARPTYRLDAGSRPYLEFDGVDDNMTAASIPFATTNKVTVFAGARKITSGMIAQVGLIYNSEPGSFAITATATGYEFLLRGTTISANMFINGFASPETAVLTQLGDFSLTTDASRARRNRLQIGTSGATVPGAATVGTKTLSLGYRSNSTNYLSGHIYGLIIRGAATSDTQVGQTETWLNARTGAY